MDLPRRDGSAQAFAYYPEAASHPSDQTELPLIKMQEDSQKFEAVS